MAYINQSEIERFLSNVSVGRADECWPWKLSRNKYGYGKFKLRGTVINASRVAMMIHLDGDPLWGKTVCHTCDNPTCCNPAHLYAGTQSDNMRDRWNRTGRSRSRSNGAKHTSHLYECAPQAVDNVK